jgi:predicted anti-sigma-YlaC factor YlaD
MDCRVIQGELFAYTLGTSSEVELDRVDEHMLTCTACLRAYLRLKRHVEQGGVVGARPSEETRRRVRDDVAAIVRPRGIARVRGWLRRPIPLYQGLVVAAIAAGVAIGLPQVASLGRKAPETTARVDMSRPVPQALAIY